MDPGWVQKSILPAMLSNCTAMVLQDTHKDHLTRAFKDRGVGGRSMDPGWVQGLGGGSMDPGWVQKSILPARLSHCNAMVLQDTHKDHLTSESI